MTLREHATFEHEDRIVIREFRFAGRLRAAPVRELSATMTLYGQKTSSTLDIDPVLNEPRTTYYRRRLEDTLLMRAEAEWARRTETVGPL